MKQKYKGVNKVKVMGEMEPGQEASNGSWEVRGDGDQTRAWDGALLPPKRILEKLLSTAAWG